MLKSDVSPDQHSRQTRGQRPVYEVEDARTPHAQTKLCHRRKEKTMEKLLTIWEVLSARNNKNVH